MIGSIVHPQIEIHIKSKGYKKKKLEQGEFLTTFLRENDKIILQEVA